MQELPLNSGFDVPAGTRALLFDCDGTLVDTLAVHRAVMTTVFAEFGFQLTDEWWAANQNRPMVPFVRAAIPDASKELIEQIKSLGEDRFDEQLHLLEPMEHVVQIAKRFHGVLPMAVCSGGHRRAVVASLAVAGIEHLFDAVVTGEDVEHSKPAPDVYLRGLELLAVEPSAAVAFEDSEIGIASARAAGIAAVVDVRDSARVDGLRQF